MINRRAIADGSGRHAPSGFTLMELLVALGVVGVATTIFISLYISSVGLANSANKRLIAMRLAEEQVQRIFANPAEYQWNLPEGATDARFSITLGEDDPKAGNPFDTPLTLPPEPGASRRATQMYDAFRWEAFGHLRANAAYFEVTVVVRWQEQGREQLVTMTSAAPRIDVERAQQSRQLFTPRATTPAEADVDAQASPATDAAPPAADAAPSDAAQAPAQPANGTDAPAAEDAE